MTIRRAEHIHLHENLKKRILSWRPAILVVISSRRSGSLLHIMIFYNSQYVSSHFTCQSPSDLFLVNLDNINTHKILSETLKILTIFSKSNFLCLCYICFFPITRKNIKYSHTILGAWLLV